MGLKITIKQEVNIRSERDFALAFPKRSRGKIWLQIRRKTFEIVARVKRQMPVDTGRARADWGSQIDQDETNLTTEQGSTLLYVPRLNEGWSRQAAAGFIDTIALAALDELEGEIADIIAKEWDK